MKLPSSVDQKLISKIVQSSFDGISENDAMMVAGRLDTVYVGMNKTKKSTESEDVRERSGTSAPKSAHVRRGHYHHFWTGPRSDRKLILTTFSKNSPTSKVGDELRHFHHLTIVT